MGTRKVIISAGYDKSQFAICVAELLLRKGINIECIFVINPFKLDRAKKVLRQRGFPGLKDGAYKLFNISPSKAKKKCHMIQFKERNNISNKSLKKWAKLNAVKYQLVDNINDSKVECFLNSIDFDWLIYCGGGIIRRNIIQASKGKILNAHLGPLPEVRGMNAIEWAILLNERNEVTIHKIDEGIDTGEIVAQYPVIIEKNDKIDFIRDKAKIAGITGIVDVVTENFISQVSLPNSASYRQCFILSNSMKELLAYKLSL